jgi:uncharacterized protein
MMPQRHLVIFARYPQLGVGKRRLAAGLGAVHALRFQRTRLALLLLRHGRDPRWRTWVATTPIGVGRWPRHLLRVDQGRGDLGQRMGRVFTALPRGPVVLIGTDIPGICGREIARAFSLLGSHDAVFGPAEDGGYWLVGLRRRPQMRLPFYNVRWSTADALADTEANVRSAAIAHVATMSDVDDIASMRKHRTWNRLCFAAPKHSQD